LLHKQLQANNSGLPSQQPRAAMVCTGRARADHRYHQVTQTVNPHCLGHCWWEHRAAGGRLQPSQLLRQPTPSSKD